MSEPSALAGGQVHGSCLEGVSPLADASGSDKQTEAGVTLATHGLDQCHSMACDVHNRCGSLVNSVAEKIQKELGVLAFSLEQCAVGYLGLARPRLRVDFPSTVSRFP